MFINFIAWLQIIYDILRLCVYIYLYGPAFGGPHSPRDGDIYKVMQVCVHLYVYIIYICICYIFKYTYVISK